MFSNKISMHRFIKKTGFRMEILVKLSSFIIPGVMLFITIYGIKSKRNIYDDFVSGAADGLKTVVKVLPTLIGLMVAVGVLSESGFMEFLGKWLGKITNPLGFPGELMPVTIVKIFSSSAATGMVLDIFNILSLLFVKYFLCYFINDELYGNYILYNVCILHNCKSNENKMDFAWCNFGNNCWNNCQCNTCKINVNTIYFD